MNPEKLSRRVRINISKFRILYQPLGKPVAWFKNTTLRNKAIIIIAFLIIAFLIVRQVRSANQEPQYVLQPVEKANIVQLVTETGNINTAGRVDVESSVTGIIEEIYVGSGEYVELNQNLFKVRSTATDQEKSAAYASYQNAFSAQKTAEQNILSLDAAMWAKQKALLDAKEAKRLKDINKNDYEDLEEQSIDSAVVQAEKDFASSEQKYKEVGIAISAARAQVNASWLAYQATQSLIVRSPTEGTVANMTVSIGDKISAGAASLSSATPSPPVLTIVNFGNYFVKIPLNEVDIPKVRVGQKASISLDAFSEESFRGSVTSVDAVGTNNAGVITYNVLVTISNPNSGIRPEMTANVEIEVNKAENVLTVPNSAVKPYRGKRAVQVINKQTKEPEYKIIEIGIKSTEKTEIKSGITEGTEVITVIRNGQSSDQGSPFGN